MTSDGLRALYGRSIDPAYDEKDRAIGRHKLASKLVANASAICDLMDAAEQAVIYRTDIGTRETAIDNMEVVLSELKGVG